MRRLLALAGVALLGFGAAACTTDEPRAAGITERWLQAVSDQGREGLLRESRDRADDYGDPQVAEAVIPSEPAEGERYFDDLEVGKAVESGNTARVPFRVTRELAGDETDELRATAVLERTPGGWHVVDVGERRADERVPSAGGERPARASLGHWLFTVGLGVVLTIVSVLVVRLQPTREQVN